MRLEYFFRFFKINCRVTIVITAVTSLVHHGAASMWTCLDTCVLAQPTQSTLPAPPPHISRVCGLPPADASPPPLPAANPRRTPPLPPRHSSAIWFDFVGRRARSRSPTTKRGRESRPVVRDGGFGAASATEGEVFGVLLQLASGEFRGFFRAPPREVSSVSASEGKSVDEVAALGALTPRSRRKALAGPPMLVECVSVHAAQGFPVILSTTPWDEAEGIFKAQYRVFDHTDALPGIDAPLLAQLVDAETNEVYTVSLFARTVRWRVCVCDECEEERA